MRIFVLDEIVVKPGLASAYSDAYAASYKPAAERRGMRLEGAWQSPPGLDFEEMPATLYYLWSLDDLSAWWRMRLRRKDDGSDERFEKHAWWRRSDKMTLSRKRSVLTQIDLEG
jgi:hypothetical protein